MVVKKNFACEIFTVKLPQTTFGILNQPDSIAFNHVHNVSEVSVFCFDLNLLGRVDGHFSDFISLSVVDVCQAPPLDEAICTRSYELIIFI